MFIQGAGLESDKEKTEGRKTVMKKEINKCNNEMKKKYDKIKKKTIIAMLENDISF